MPKGVTTTGGPVNTTATAHPAPPVVCALRSSPPARRRQVAPTATARRPERQVPRRSDGTIRVTDLTSTGTTTGSGASESDDHPREPHSPSEVPALKCGLMYQTHQQSSGLPGLSESLSAHAGTFDRWLATRVAQGNDQGRPGRLGPGRGAAGVAWRAYAPRAATQAAKRGALRSHVAAGVGSAQRRPYDRA